MPNPITLATPATTAPAKPTSPRNETGQASGVTRFEDIFGQEGNADDLPDNDLPIAVPENEESGTEAESVDLTEPEAAPLAEPLRVAELASNSTHVADSMPVAGREHSNNTPAQAGVPSAPPDELPDPPNFSAATGQPNRADPHAPVVARPETGQVLPALSQHVTPVAVAEKSRPVDRLTKATGKSNAPETTPTFQSVETAQRPEVAPAAGKPTTPAHAPPVAQLKMMANLIEKGQAVFVEEAEPIVVAKDEPLQTTPRDTTQHNTSRDSQHLPVQKSHVQSQANLRRRFRLARDPGRRRLR